MAHAGLLPGDLHWLQTQEIDDDLVFHYTQADSLAAILTNGTLRLGPYSNTNDPREQKEWRAGLLMPAGRARPPAKYLEFARDHANEVDEATDRYLRRGACLACFGVDRAPLADAGAGCLFHRGWARARMWDQYAEKHKGACLVFNKLALLEAIDKQIPHAAGDLFLYGNVEYRDQPRTIPLKVGDLVNAGIAEVLDHLQVLKDAASHLYMTKNTDWQSEQEYRIVVVRWDVAATEENQPLEIDFRDALKAIVFGEHYAGDVKTLVGARIGVDVLRCWWGDGVPMLADT